MVPPITVGLVVKVFAFNVLVVPFQKYRTKFAAMASDFVTVAPVPWMTVLTVSLLFASSFGIFTTGVAPNAPATVTDAFAFELALEVELALEDGFDEPQPAMTRQASTGITVIARRRRMKNLNVVDGFAGPGGRPLEPRWPAVVLAIVSCGRRAVGPRGPCDHMPAMSFSPFVHGPERVICHRQCGRCGLRTRCLLVACDFATRRLAGVQLSIQLSGKRGAAHLSSSRRR